MSAPVLVLDTNVAAYTPVDDLERLAKAGFVLRVGEGALLERWVQAVREYDDNRAKARAKFFGRFRSIAPFLDQTTPVAVGGGHLLRGIIAQADGLPPVAETEERVQELREQWRHIVGVGLNDEEWVKFGREVAPQHLDLLDSVLIDLAKPAEELRKRVAPELQEDNRRFEALPDEEQRALLFQHIADTLKLSAAATERIDAHVRTMAFRLQVASKGQRMPKRNDGVDLSLTGHLGAGEGHFVLTGERKLVDIVDQSGTFQAPWVRRPDDLDDLPAGPPWGESAREAARKFKRRT